jgi:hypothetical protein
VGGAVAVDPTLVSYSCPRFVGVEEALQQGDQRLQLFVCECGERRGGVVQDGFGCSDGVKPAGSEEDELATAVVRMGTTLDKPVLFELVDDERDVWTGRMVELGELAMGQWAGAQLEQDFASPGSKAEAERFFEVAVTTVLVDELPHERPGLLA